MKGPYARPLICTAKHDHWGMIREGGVGVVLHERERVFYVIVKT